MKFKKLHLSSISEAMVQVIFFCFVLSCSSVVIGKSITSDLLPDTSTCGKVNGQRIVGGTWALLGEFPWMALLASEGINFHCGGVLISNRYVLTAAHCFDNQGVTNVRLGEYDLSKDEDCDPSTQSAAQPTCAPYPQDIKVEKIIKHESYNKRRSDNTNDIALIRLSKEVSFSDYVKPICLPVSEPTEKYAGVNATVAGWGKTEVASASEILLKLKVPVKANSDCTLQLGDSQLCAGGVAGKDSCAGDSGGPLMTSKDDEANWYLIGIVSYGLRECAVKGIEAIYTRVTFYLPWIVSNLEP